MAEVNLHNVSKIYPDGFKAVDQVNLSIEDGEFVVLVGPSGCGKSTTLRMIAGLETISQGELLIDQLMMNQRQPKDRDIAMVFQSYALYPHMTTRDNIAFALKIAGQDRKTRYAKVDQVAKILQLEEVLDRKPEALSGGQRQRVALGRAMVREPKVFLLDEPLSNLDAKLRVTMRSEIVSLHRKLATTFIYVTHDQTEAMTMGDRIAVMNQGHVEQFDTPDNLYNRPHNLFVAQFIGSPQMNIGKAVIRKQGQQTILDFANHQVELSHYPIGQVEIPSEGLEVWVGIRPENIAYVAEKDQLNREEPRDSKNKISIHLENVEQVGSDTYVYFNFAQDASPWVARFNPPQNVKVGQTVQVHFNPDKLLFFDRKTELNLFADEIDKEAGS